MSEIITREPRGDEMPVWRSIWENVFGCVGMEAFFLRFFSPDLCVIAEFEGSPAAMGYLVPFGEIVTGSESIHCMMIYSVATRPEYRGKGLGTAVVRKLIERAREYDFSTVVLCPSEDGLFEYYSARTDLRDYFYVKESIFKTAPVSTNKVIPVEISTSEYYYLRENLLNDTIHIKHDLRALGYQAEICKELGGGLYKIGDCCAVVERQCNNKVWVKELLTSNGQNVGLNSTLFINDILASIACVFPADEYVVRTPAMLGEGRRFGMLVHSNEKTSTSVSTKFAPWYGIAFD